jgi:AbrB family looped-hinge helix DNA binding protein
MMRITSKGQVTIPQAVREATGMLPNTDVDFVIDEGEVRLIKVSTETRRRRGVAAVRRLRDHGRKVRMTTDEIMALTRGEE